VIVIVGWSSRWQVSGLKFKRDTLTYLVIKLSFGILLFCVKDVFRKFWECSQNTFYNLETRLLRKMAMKKIKTLTANTKRQREKREMKALYCAICRQTKKFPAGIFLSSGQGIY